MDHRHLWKVSALLTVVCLAALLGASCSATPTADDAAIAAKIATGVAATQTADVEVYRRVGATLTAVAGGAPPTSTVLSPTPVPEPPTSEPPTAIPEPPTQEPPTATPEPPTLEPPTATPEPPTLEPPTATPEPPTATPEPPTATPEPPTPEPPTATARPAARPALIAYTVTETFRQHYRIEIINSDGTGQRLLTDMASEPAFSPNGQEVIFYAWPGGLEVMRLDGSQRRRVVQDTEAAFPSWSPNGKYIAYHSIRGGEGRFNIYIANADGTQERQLVDGEQATWSPDSSRLAYKGCEGSSCGLMIVNLDGSGKRRLTTCDKCANDGNPSWSPESNLIAFTSERDGNHEIYIMSADGGSEQRLTWHEGPDALPAWMPGGNEIAFRSFRDGQWGIYIMTVDGQSVRKVTNARVDPNRWIWEKMSATAR
jgi:hypothetical protein